MEDDTYGQKAPGNAGETDAAIARELLSAKKNAIINYAAAILRTADAEAKLTIHGLLNAQIDLHGEICRMMMEKGWINPYDIRRQFQMDIESAQGPAEPAKARN